MKPSSKYITQGMPETDYIAAVENFKNVATANAAALGLSEPQVAQITAAAAEIASAYESWTTAVASAKAVLVTKDETFADTKALIDSFAKLFRADNGIPDALLAELAVAPHIPTRSFNAPVTPTGFTGSATANGQITLKWKREGNTSSTQFIVESATSDAGPWTLATITNSTKATLQATPGQFITYRVVAKKGNDVADPTDAFSFWVGSGESSVSLSIAA